MSSATAAAADPAAADARPASSSPAPPRPAAAAEPETPWYRRVNWHAVALYGLVIGAATWYAIRSYRELAERAESIERHRSQLQLLHRLRDTPGGRFRV
jgi:hypothetical protein